MKGFINELFVVFATLIFTALGIRIWLEGWPWTWS